MRTGSHLHALFRGQQEREFSWFAAGASLPLVSMNAERAARQIVQATRRRAATRILSLPANVLERFHGLCPGTTTNILRAVNRLLPTAEGTRSAGTARGMEVQRRLRSPVLDVLTRLGRAAAQRLHQESAATRE
jgi:hypothetical protein